MRKILFYVIVILFTNDLKSQEVNQTISDKDKILGLSTYWKEASYNFVYFDRIPKLNWDSAYAAFIPKVLATKNLFEYSRELKKFAGLLQDGHSDVSYASIDTLFIKRSFGKYKIELREFDNKILVINTAEKTKDEIPIGSEIITVNNIPTEKYLKENILPFFSSNRDYISREMAVNSLLMGLKGTNVKIEIKTPENKIKTFDLERKFIEGKWQCALNEGN